jgi:predicted enzyme related to lactoylglutathione lyase
MAETTAPPVNKPIWIDLSSSDPAASREFYAKLFGWQVEVNPDPQYGGYALAKIGGKDVAGIGLKMMPEAPTAWSVYIGTADAADLATKVQAAGGTIIAPPMQVGDQGRMAVFQDPSGAFIGAWQPMAMSGFVTGAPGTYRWAELNSRGVEKALAFYAAVFGWVPRTNPMGEGQPPYTEFLVGDGRIAGGMEMNPMVPGRGAQLLDGLLRRRRRGRLVPQGDRGRRPGDAGPAGLPRWTFRDPRRPAGRNLRTAQDD